MFLTGFFGSIVLIAVEFVHPLMETLKLLEESAKEGKDEAALKKQYSQWVTYWVLLAVLESVVSKVFYAIMDNFPFLVELKIGLVVWLAFYEGAFEVWNSYISKLYAEYEKPVHEMIDKALPMLKELSKMKPRDVPLVQYAVQLLEQERKTEPKENKQPEQEVKKPERKPDVRKPEPGPVEERKEEPKSEPVAKESTPKSAEVKPKKITSKELKIIARQKGADDEQIDNFDDADDPKQAIMDFIIQKSNVKALKDLARQRGASEAEIEACDEADNVKPEVGKLILSLGS
jgi:hypothetical protein